MSRATSDFGKSATPKARPAPFSIRLTAAEKARLRAEAGAQPLGRYIRSRLLGPLAEKRRAARSVRVDEAVLGQALALLGQSRLSSNLNQIARAANIGTLPITPDLVADLEAARDHVAEMRALLLAALRVQETP